MSDGTSTYRDINQHFVESEDEQPPGFPNSLTNSTPSPPSNSSDLITHQSDSPPSSNMAGQAPTGGLFGPPQPPAPSFATITNQGVQGTVPSQPTQTSTHLQGINGMPTRGSRHAPQTFRGKFRKVERFIKHYERLLAQHNVTTEADKCEAILDYCSDSIADFIHGNQHYLQPDWKSLKEDILKYYDADRTHTMFTPEDLVEFAYTASKRRMQNLAHWKKYYRDYSIISGFLTKKQLITTRDVDGYFWHGIPSELRTLFEFKLQATNPKHDAAVPWPMEKVTAIAESHFKRDKFSKMFFHSTKLANHESSDESDGGSSSDSESSDSDYDSDTLKTLKRRIKKMSHKKKKSKKKSSKEEKLDFPPHPTPAPPDRTSRFNGTTDEVENMIQRLNSMSLNDPSYGHLYYKVLQMDASGIAARCIYREPQRVTGAPSYQPSPPQNVMLPRRSFQTANTPSNQPPPMMIFPQENRCYGCHGADHMMGECPKMAELLEKGIIIQDAATRKYTFQNGQRIFRNRTESIYDAVMRQVGLPSSNFVTYDSDLLNDHVSHQVTYPDSDSDFSNTDTESDSDDGPYWKYAQHAKRELRYPTYASEHAPLSVYDAERVTRQTKEARHNATRVARKPTAAPKTKQSLKPIVEIPRRPTPASVPIPNDIVMQPSELQPPDPRPIDARRVRFPNDHDIEKAISSRAQKFGPSADAGKSQEQMKASDKSRPQPRQSDLSSQVDTRNVVRQILDTEVSLPLRQILGTSKELAASLQEVIKLKNRGIPPQQAASVNNTQVHYMKNECLIHLRVSHNDTTIFAIIDTGSMLNIIDGSLANAIITLPIDTAHRPFMKDANGGHSQMRGVVRNVDLDCGSITTTADLHVSESSPFRLLLGRPWQRQNFVSIDERVNGTYIVFKDPHTHEPRYEVKATAVTPRPAMRDYTDHLQANMCYFQGQQSAKIKECEPNCSPDSLMSNAESILPFSAEISAEDASGSDDDCPPEMCESQMLNYDIRQVDTHETKHEVSSPFCNNANERMQSEWNTTGDSSRFSDNFSTHTITHHLRSRKMRPDLAEPIEPVPETNNPMKDNNSAMEGISNTCQEDLGVQVDLTMPGLVLHCSPSKSAETRSEMDLRSTETHYETSNKAMLMDRTIERDETMQERVIVGLMEKANSDESRVDFDELTVALAAKSNIRPEKRDLRDPVRPIDRPTSEDDPSIKDETKFDEKPIQHKQFFFPIMSSTPPTLQTLHRAQERLKELFSDSPHIIHAPMSSPLSLQLQTDQAFIINHGSSPYSPDCDWSDIILFNTHMDVVHHEAAHQHAGTVYLRIFHDSTHPVQVIPLPNLQTNSPTPPPSISHSPTRFPSPTSSIASNSFNLRSHSQDIFVFHASVDFDPISFDWGSAAHLPSYTFPRPDLGRSFSDSEEAFFKELEAFQKGDPDLVRGFSIPPDLMEGGKVLPALEDGSVPFIFPKVDTLLPSSLQLVISADTLDSLGYSHGQPVFDFITNTPSPSVSDSSLPPLSPIIFSDLPHLLTPPTSPDANASLITLHGSPDSSPEPSEYGSDDLDDESDHYTSTDPLAFNHRDHKPFSHIHYLHLRDYYLPHLVRLTTHAVTWTNIIAGTNPRIIDNTDHPDPMEIVLADVDIPTIFRGCTTAADVTTKVRSSTISNLPNLWEPFVATLLPARKAMVDVLHALNTFFISAGFDGLLGYIDATGLDLYQRFSENTMLLFEEWAALYHAYHFFSQHGERILARLIHVLLYVPYHEPSQLTLFRHTFLSALIPSATRRTDFGEEVD